VSATPCLQVAAVELAASTLSQQARPAFERMHTRFCRMVQTQVHRGSVYVGASHAVGFHVAPVVAALHAHWFHNVCFRLLLLFSSSHAVQLQWRVLLSDAMFSSIVSAAPQRSEVCA
jgi:hypothetical protein